jgi:hypothetical protein
MVELHAAFWRLWLKYPLFAPEMLCSTASSTTMMAGQNIAIPLDVGSGWLADATARSVQSVRMLVGRDHTRVTLAAFH